MSALWALAAFVMTLAGGAFAFRYRRYLLYIMAASAGLLPWVAASEAGASSAADENSQESSSDKSALSHGCTI